LTKETVGQRANISDSTSWNARLYSLSSAGPVSGNSVPAGYIAAFDPRRLNIFLQDFPHRFGKHPSENTTWY
jgi:hypothetical protein